MAPVQNTFSIIPDLPSAINGNRHGGPDDSNARASRPPMTTKQVKKAYQKANKGPKLSKAEQRRQELFEQDRIRKEFEKEKNQARVRAARDKRRERKERERAEKKKKGLPLVDVRPSQDTIARFVRAKPKSQRDGSASPLREDEGRCRSVSLTAHNAGNGKPRGFDDADKENVRHTQKRSYAMPVHTSHGLCDTSPAPDHTAPPDKRRRVESEEDQTSPPIIDGVVSPSLKHDPTVSVVGDRVQGTPGPDTKQGRLSIDDSFSTIDPNEENFLDDLLDEMNGASSSPNAPEESLLGQQDQSPPTQSPPPKPPEDPVPFPKRTGGQPSCLERAAEPTASLPPPKPVLSPKPVPDLTRTPRQNPIPTPTKQGLTPHSSAAPSTWSVRRLNPNVPSSRSFRHPRPPMAPPPVPPKFTLSKQVTTGRPSTSQFLKPPLPPPRTAARGSHHSHVAGSKQVRDNELPPSTQLFLLGHLDDFLPSPSQEAREIFEEPQEEHTKNVNIPGLMVMHTGNKDFKLNQHKSGMPTASCNTSVNSRSSINPRGSHHIQQTADRPRPSKAAIRTPIQPIPQQTPSAFEMPFFSTQDLLLSSQDVKDIEEPLSSLKAHNPTPIATKVYVEPCDASRRSPKPFFTSTCRELRYKYALERSRTAAWEGPGARQKAREELDRLQMLEDERLEALLGNPSKETENGNTGTIAGGVELDAVGNRPFTVPSHRMPMPQVQPCRGWSGRGSYSISEETAQKHTRMSPDVQRSRLGSGGNSYETMLDMLTKAPKQKPDAHVTNIGADGDGNKDMSRHVHSEQTKASEAMMTTASSQETDYDCGEDWDDDDLLCDML
ncbi:hypothetical protein F5B21DRAFT_496261 [Xylaria acuta]|nr:hypothetical protein F5B21DRAFT_496261 [Xylaria acuta]